jgi:hypothetical protein
MAAFHATGERRDFVGLNNDAKVPGAPSEKNTIPRKMARFGIAIRSRRFRPCQNPAAELSSRQTGMPCSNPDRHAAIRANGWRRCGDVEKNRTAHTHQRWRRSQVPPPLRAAGCLWLHRARLFAW